MRARFSGGAIALSDLKSCPSRVVDRATADHLPVLLTRRGRSVAVLQSFTDYEAEAEERSFMRGVAKGLLDLEEGREISLSEVRKLLSQP